VYDIKFKNFNKPDETKLALMTLSYISY